MNKREANVSLFIITFFAAIQYAFLEGVPDSVSHFAFLCVTNLIGFLLTLAVFFSELFRVDRKQIRQSLLLSLELFGFNVFLLLGSSVGATVSACVLSAYFVFLPLLSLLLFKFKSDKMTLCAVGVVLAGLALMMLEDPAGLKDIHFLYLLIADVFFALYILTVGRFTAGSNPSILAMGQMLFNCLIALLFWVGQSAIQKTPLSLPTDSAFWGSAILIGFFIRGLYGIVQMFAQRYVSPLNTSLIFSTEIIITMLMSPVLALLFGTQPERITPLRLAGAGVMVLGILLADPSVTGALKRRLRHEKS